MRIFILLSVFLLNGCIYYVYEQPAAGVSPVKSEKNALPSKVEIIPQSESLPLEAYPKDISANTAIIPQETPPENNTPVMIISGQENTSAGLISEGNMGNSDFQTTPVKPSEPVPPTGSYNNPIKFKQ